jgi:hypothetical protein
MRLFRRKAAPSAPVNSPKNSDKSPMPGKLMITSETEEATHLVLHSATVGELADLYQVSRPTMRKWLKPFLKRLGEIMGRNFTVRQVEMIIRFLGIPGKRIRMSGRLA